MTTSKVSLKNNELTQQLQAHFHGWHKSRVKFISGFILSLIKSSSVVLTQLANGFDSAAKVSSTYRRIQRFISSFDLDYLEFSCCILKLMGQQGKPLVLCLDRTNWKFGCFEINILMLAFAYRGVAVPLLWTVLDKKGNSSTNERIELLELFIQKHGKQAIDCIVCDREFIGKDWFRYLISNRISFYIRIKENMQVMHKNKLVAVKKLFNGVAHLREYAYAKPFLLDGNMVYLSGMRLESEYLIIASYYQPHLAFIKYRMRWQIETLFKALKSRGFNLEGTHLKDVERIKKLIALLSIAFTWAYLIGLWRHKILKPVRQINAKDGVKQEFSFFNYGLSFIKNALLNNYNTSDFQECCRVLSCT